MAPGRARRDRPLGQGFVLRDDLPGTLRAAGLTEHQLAALRERAVR